MQSLVAHSAHPPRSIRSVHAQIITTPQGGLMVRYRVEGIEALILPPFAGRGREDGLWQTTCFELFASGPTDDYREYNFSPSRRWAAYRFSAYREGMRPFDPDALPEISVRTGDKMLVANVSLSGTELDGMDRVGLCAVIEEEGGYKSYWALAHGGDKPDFHDPACFAGELGTTARA